jgi:hypothetical protein
MSFSLERLIEELDSQKRKYHEKVLSADGELTTFLRTMQIWDFTFDISQFLIPEFFYSSMFSSLLFNIDLWSIEPYALEFTWRSPTLEEWLKGVGVVIEKVIPDYATDVETFIENNIKEEYQSSIEASMLEKGYYGKSRYGRCYYDPAAVREFLRNTITMMFKRHPDFITRKSRILALTETFGVKDDVVRMIHDRISMIKTAQTETFILGYSILGKSKLSEEVRSSELKGKVPFINFEGKMGEANVRTLADMQYGFILGVTPLGYGFLMPEEDIYKIEAPSVTRALENKLTKFRTRFVITPPAVSNYVRGDESADYRICERTEVWGELLSMRYTIEGQTESFLMRNIPSMDAFERRKYISAVLQLIGYIGKRHEWGFKVFKMMKEEEIKKWWIDQWASQGLDVNILEKLWENVKTWLELVIKKKLELGKSLRLKRLGIPLD